jgi:adenylyltransferase/sulfurtransferase
MEALLGVARVFTPPHSCYECTLTDQDWQAIAHRQSCRLLSRADMLEGKVPTTATTASIVSGVLAQEVVKLLHRERPGVQSLQGAIVIDGTNNDAYPVSYPFDDDCLAHDTHDTTTTFDVSSDTTISDLFEALGWPDGIAELGDDHLTAWRCTACAVDAPALGAIRDQDGGAARCPRCGEPRLPVTTTAIEAASALASERLEDLGVRTDELVRLRGSRGEASIWLRDGSPYPETWR